MSLKPHFGCNCDVVPDCRMERKMFAGSAITGDRRMRAVRLQRQVNWRGRASCPRYESVDMQMDTPEGTPEEAPGQKRRNRRPKPGQISSSKVESG